MSTYKINACEAISDRLESQREEIKQQQEIQKQNEIQAQKQGEKKPVDALTLAYIYICETMKTLHESAEVQANNLEQNALTQQKLTAEETDLKFQMIDKSQLYDSVQDDAPTNYAPMTSAGRAAITYNIPDSKPTYHEELKNDASVILALNQNENQVVTEKRTNIESTLMTMRQNAQMSETKLNSSVNEVMQAQQQASALMQMVSTLTTQILGR